ncbi:DEKNAAC102050 [Brettanomyces naardenensis]|uniref:DEKNAAC102050 n=1 Tax=Brettanomyces naardenensis TaxID=13370 RepID=A0A448YJU0_BRENA|nr:DEKNAAC102050 [Brettanomyces naardenensis]
MTSNSWKTDVLSQLKEQDERTQEDGEMFKSFIYLSDKMHEQDLELSTLRQDDSKEKLFETLRENQRLKEEVDSNDKIIREKDNNIGELRTQVQTLKKNFDVLRRGYVKVRSKNAILQEESHMRDQNIEGINDSMLSLQIENDMLSKSIESLKSEHEQLVQRWISKVAKDAEVLNEANKVLEMAGAPAGTPVHDKKGAGERRRVKGREAVGR